MTKTLELSQGKVALVDDEDYEWLSRWKWTYNNGYAVRRERRDGKRHTIWLHLEIIQPPEGYKLDHKNRDGLDNRRKNLRICTEIQNNINRRSGRGNGYRGVQKRKQDTRWRAVIYLNKKLIRIGAFDNAVDAAKAYDEKARELYGEFAYTNF